MSLFSPLSFTCSTLGRLMGQGMVRRFSATFMALGMSMIHLTLFHWWIRFVCRFLNSCKNKCFFYLKQVKIALTYGCENSLDMRRLLQYAHLNHNYHNYQRIASMGGALNKWICRNTCLLNRTIQDRTGWGDWHFDWENFKTRRNDCRAAEHYLGTVSENFEARRWACTDEAENLIRKCNSLVQW